MDGRENWWANLQFGWRYLFDPDNPFIPWMLIIDLVLLAGHLAIVYWVYRDALARYNRGAPWAVLAMVIPVGGWLFYLLYRQSPLVQFDRLEAELFDESEHEWTDYDNYRTSIGKQLFSEVSSLWRKPEGEGYSPWVRLSRLRELRKIPSPAEREARAAERLEKRKQRAQQREEARQAKAERAQARRERTTMTGRHGFRYKLSDRRQNKLKSRLEIVEKLKALPREDQALEDLIYEMQYAEALKKAREALEVADEMGDAQGIVTYQAYIERIERIMDESRS
jgi:hypothetical protein